MAILSLPRNTTVYKLGGTETFRASSAALFGTFGGNLQNVDKDMRSMYWADEGKILCQVDQSGAEALIVAYLCEPGRFRELFLHGVKPHVFVAMNVFLDRWKILCKDIDVNSFVSTPIPELKKREGWQILDKIIKESDNWKPSERYYYIAKMICHACLTSDTEVLTKTGWIPISTTSTETNIAVWDIDNTIKFEKPLTFHEYDSPETLLEFNEPQLNQCITPNHRLPIFANGKITVRQAEQLLTYKGGRLPLSGYYDGPNFISDTDARLTAAIQADGHIVNEGCVQFRFRKERKYKRLLELCNRAGYKFTISRYAEMNTDSLTYSIRVFGLQTLIKQFNGVKVFDRWLLDWNGRALDALLNELSHWDGYYEKSIHHKREEYYSMIKQNVEWIKTILHLRGKQGTITQSSDGLYTIGINNRFYSRINKPKAIKGSGKVYCYTTSTGFFLTRRNGKISVTGNSNYGMKGAAFQLNVLEKSRGQIVITKQQADEYLMRYHSLFPEITRWHRWVERQLRETKCLYNLFGFPRQLTGRFDETDAKEWYAFTPQSTVGCITHIACTHLQRYIDTANRDWDLLGNCHDSYLAQCPVGEERELATVMLGFMQQLLRSFRGEEFKMRAEAQVGYNWGPYKKDKNEKGLQEIKL